VTWESCWRVDCRATKSGTPEFMSRALLFTQGERLHSPVDDLESFFWVALWSILFNSKSREKLEAERRIGEALIANDKDTAMSQFCSLAIDKRRNEVTQRFQHVIKDWWLKVRDRDEDWTKSVMANRPEGAKGEYYLPHFHLYALQGVADFLEVLERHWSDGICSNSWSAL